MEFIELLRSSLIQELSEKESTLEALINVPSISRFNDCKRILRDISLIKLSISTLIDMIPPEN